MSVAFEGIDRLVVTFLAGDVTAGKPVVMGGEGSVKNASSGQMPVGVALHARDGHAAVQLKGFVTVQYSGTSAPALGWTALAKINWTSRWWRETARRRPWTCSCEDRGEKGDCVYGISV